MTIGCVALWKCNVALGVSLFLFLREYHLIMSRSKRLMKRSLFVTAHSYMQVVPTKKILHALADFLCVNAFECMNTNVCGITVMCEWVLP